MSLSSHTIFLTADKTSRVIQVPVHSFKGRAVISSGPTNRIASCKQGNGDIQCSDITQTMRILSVSFLFVPMHGHCQCLVHGDITLQQVL